MLHGMCVKMFVDCVAPHITPPVDCVAPHIKPPVDCVAPHITPPVDCVAPHITPPVDCVGPHITPPVHCVAPHITPPVDCVAPHITPPIQCYVTESHQTGDPARTTRTFPCTPLLMIPASRRSVAATERLGWRSNLRPLSYSCRFVTSGSPYREWSSQ